MNIMPDVVDAQFRLQFLGRDVMLPSVMASDPAHDPNALPVEALKITGTAMCRKQLTSKGVTERPLLQLRRAGLGAF